MDTPLAIGVIEGEVPTQLGLARAAARNPGMSLTVLRSDAAPADGIAGLIVDVPLQHRPAVVAGLAQHWHVPLLVESPVAADRRGARGLEDLADTLIVAANPLRYALHTRRLLEELAQAGDRLETYFVASRFRTRPTPEHALPQLLDFLQAVCPDQLARISAMRTADASILTLSLRYASDVLGSIELGNHLPKRYPADSELVVECFCRSSAYACTPGNQAVQLYGRDHAAIDWQPDPADRIVTAFGEWLSGGSRPPGGIGDDLKTLGLVEHVNQALELGGVLDLQAALDAG